MTKILIFPQMIGFNVKNALLSAERLTVQGITTKGVFIITSQDDLYFLSYESYRGPNTLNFPGRRHPFQVEIGETVQILGERLDFKNFQISLAEPCQVWQPATALPNADLRHAFDRLVPLTRLVYQHKPDAGFSEYLPFYLDGRPFEDKIGQNLINIHKASSYKTILLDIFPDLVGWGRGLTPSGDDMIAGFLLFFCRVSAVTPPDLAKSLPEFFTLVKNKTTTLSRNIIEGSANGIGEERLLALVDYSQGAVIALDEVADGLLTYG
ncbi:MAG: DUF2877 domain-containing protein, partial [Anaerolineaceae bacterium]|nr:DUF2877 domain-containing protein [Anaerolineaceae bacterium]